MKQLIDYQVKNNKELMHDIIMTLDYQRVITRLVPSFYSLAIARVGLDLMSKTFKSIGVKK